MMKKQIRWKISIIIPVYNVEASIERCLLSALNQSYPDIEYVLVDDATPDHSMKMAVEMIDNHPRKNTVKIVHHPENRGLSAARNTGVKHATGNYVFFLDSDDEMTPDCIETLVQSVNQQEVDFVIGETEVTGNKRKAYPPLDLKNGIYQGNDFVLKSFLKRQWYEMAWNKLIRRSIFTEKHCWFEEGIVHEDTLWSFQLALIAQSMTVTQAQTYIYHIQSNSITQKKSKRNIESFYFVLKRIICLSVENNLFDHQKAIFDYLGRLRIFFLKMLVKNNFEAGYVREQTVQLDKLFTQYVWTKKKKSLLVRLKERIILKNK
jgi:glycosyltransferase involved in cell wall biosynthesis